VRCSGDEGTRPPLRSLITFDGAAVMPSTSIRKTEYDPESDLREWHMLRAWCRNCSHHAEVKAPALIRGYGRDALFSTVERALFCTSCERGGPVRLEIHKLPRN
jgi:hypothetical protein